MRLWLRAAGACRAAECGRSASPLGVGTATSVPRLEILAGFASEVPSSARFRFTFYWLTSRSGINERADCSTF
jgi:hypothetical protein